MSEIQYLAESMQWRGSLSEESGINEAVAWRRKASWPGEESNTGVTS